MRWILGVLPLLCLSLAQDKPKFPDFYKLFEGGYQFKAELITQQKKIVYIEEYFDISQDIGRLDMTINGDKESILYYPGLGTQTLIKYADNFCFNEPLDTSYTLVNYDDFVIPAFAYDKDKYVLGPSAVFKMSTSSKAEYVSTEIVRGMDVHKFEFNYASDGASVFIYFTLDTWTDAFTGREGSFPVRILIDGPVKLPSGKLEKVYQTFDITYLVPYVKDYTLFQIPTGIGCTFEESDDSIPKLPDSFSFVEERYNITKGEKTKEESDIDIYKVWYDATLKIARLEQFTKKYFGNYEIVDFNKGILYNFNEHGVCTILSSYESSFSMHSDKITPQLKTPKQLFYLDKGQSYRIGKARSRGIMCDVWETIATDYEMGGVVIPKVVHTYYFSAENWVDNMPGSNKDRIPVRIFTTFYGKNEDTENEENPSFKLMSRVDVNFFAFKEDFSDDIDKFDIENCYPADIEKQLIEILFKTDLTTEFLAELNNYQVRNYLLIALMEQFGITSLRIPFISIDYEPNVVKARVLILEAPNILDSFYSLSGKMGTLVEPDGDSVLLEGSYSILPYCAKACLEDSSCSQFFYCNSEQLCYIKNTTEISSKVQKEIGCDWYTKSDMEVTGPELLLKELIEILTKNVFDGKLVVPLIVNNQQITLKASEVKKVDINSKIDRDIHKFRLVVPNSSLNTKEETVVSSISANTQFDCFRKCDEAKDIACVSFSFCPSTFDCILTSTYIKETDTVKATGILTSSTKCSVFSKTYINLFDKYDGTLPISSTKEIPVVANAEDCAERCKNDDKITCRGFEYCDTSKSCSLHSTHYLDIKPDDRGKPVTGCAHYSLKYSLDYYAAGKHIFTDGNDEKIVDSSVENCAKYCSEDKGTACKSFNFCPGENTCIIHSITIADGQPANSNCELYTKKSVSDEILASKEDDAGGVTSGGLAGVIFVTLFIGIILGAAAFMGYSYYRSKKLNDNDGMAVRFVKTEE